MKRKIAVLFIGVCSIGAAFQTFKGNVDLRAIWIDRNPISTPAPSPVGEFEVGVNVGGAAVTIEGENWVSWTTATTTLGVTTANVTGSWAVGGLPTYSPTPTTDELVMLKAGAYRATSVNGQGFTIAHPVDSGTFNLYVWIAEDVGNNAHSTNISCEGTTVGTNVGVLQVATWSRYGPFSCTVTDGVFTLDITRNGAGEPVIQGYALYRVPQSYALINLGDGSAPSLTIDGEAWQSDTTATAAGWTLASTPNTGKWHVADDFYTFAYVPTVFDDRARMFRSGYQRNTTVNGEGMNMSKSVPNGWYDIAIWCMENWTSNNRNMHVRLEGTQVTTTAIGDLANGAWERYGAWRVHVTDGVLNVDVVRASKGDPQINGLEIRSVSFDGTTIPDPPDPPTDPGAESPPSDAMNVVTQCGANGSDTNSDSAAFQTCVNNLANSGRFIYAPAGTYYINETVNWKPGVKLIGARGQTVIKIMDRADKLLPFKLAWQDGSFGGIVVSSIIFDGQNTGRCGWHLDASTTNFEARWNVFTNCIVNGSVNDYAAFFITGSNTGLKIHHNIFIGNPNANGCNNNPECQGWQPIKTSYSTTNNAEITDNYFTGAFEPIHFYRIGNVSSGLKILRNTFVRSTRIPVEIQEHINGTEVRNNWFGDFHNCTNTCVPEHTWGSEQGFHCNNMYVSMAQGNDNANVDITNNVFLGNWTRSNGQRGVGGAGWGVEASFGQDGSEVTNNVFRYINLILIEHATGSANPYLYYRKSVSGAFTGNSMCGGWNGDPYNQSFASFGWTLPCPSGQTTWEGLMAAFPKPAPPWDYPVPY